MKQAMQTGMFITFEGPDGAGKTTQLQKLAAWLPNTLTSASVEPPAVITTREPGGTDVSEKIRSVLLDDQNSDLSPQTELLLFAASRASHVDLLIRPEIAAGNWVLCDRFEDSTRAYQGAGRRLNANVIDEACRLGAQGLTPDLTVLLDVPAQISAARRNDRGADDRMESAGTEFHQRVREQFLGLADQEPERFLVLDGTQPADVLRGIIRKVVLAHIRTGKWST